tara:strand:+ start:840 stop:1025 length:186 start_codon:yes stop_codon:yes gene_type:complete
MKKQDIIDSINSLLDDVKKDIESDILSDKEFLKAIGARDALAYLLIHLDLKESESFATFGE